MFILTGYIYFFLLKKIVSNLRFTHSTSPSCIQINESIRIPQYKWIQLYRNDSSQHNMGVCAAYYMADDVVTYIILSH